MRKGFAGAGWLLRLTTVMSNLPFDDEHAALYSVGQVADMLGVQPAFVRRLDSEHVVEPSRSEGGQRRYSRAEIECVQRVATMADQGMSLAGIRRILVLEAQVEKLKRQLSSLRRSRRESADD
jgi:MerR family transcriptional regulator, heat shock protein HspR